jgi:phytanoyl-CoA hydroxylase
MLSERHWQDFHRDGFLHLGQILTAEEVEALKQRADDLAMGVVKNPDIQMQLDTGGEYEDLPAAVPQFESGTRLYRKIQGLENDPLFLRLIQSKVCLEVCARVYGSHAAVSLFRAMIMNKPAGQGTILPWHQDGGNVWALDRDPLVTIWVALDEATTGNGCMECIPGSHRLGLLSQFGSTVSEQNVTLHCPPERAHPLEVKAGHAILLHNWLIHRSGVNPSPAPRRAFTMCCMDGRTRSTLTGNRFPIIAGSLPEESENYLRQFLDERATLRQSTREAVEYAKSLEAENKILRQMREEAEKYALSLEAERASRMQMEAAKSP